MALVFFLISFYVSDIVNMTNSGVNNVPEWKKNVASLVPHAGIAYVLDNSLILEEENIGLTFENANDLLYNYRVSYYFLFCLLNIAVYLLFGVYLD